MDARVVLAEVARLGPFFAVDTNPAEAVDPTWRPLPELASDPEPLRRQIAHVGRVLGADERVAASIAFQGLAARIVSAPFATAVRHGVVPDLAQLHWRPATSGPWPLFYGADALLPADLPALLDEHLGALVAGVRAQVAVSPRILWSSVASVVASAAAQVGGPDAAAVLRGLLAVAPLAGHGELAPAFRRRGCCLYYRVPGGGLCGDCVLHARAGGSTVRPAAAPDLPAG